MHNSTGVISPQVFNFPPLILDDFEIFIDERVKRWIPEGHQPDFFPFTRLTVCSLTLLSSDAQSVYTGPAQQKLSFFNLRWNNVPVRANYLPIRGAHSPLSCPAFFSHPLRVFLLTAGINAPLSAEPTSSRLRSSF